MGAEVPQHFQLGLWPQVKQLTRRAVEIPHVDEADLSAVYSMADLLVQPSLIEGFGLPVLEAMACGCPVACSNIASLLEVAGDAAVVFDPRSESEIAAALHDVLSSRTLRDHMQQRGLERVTKFSWEAAARMTLDLYRQAAG